MLTTVAECILQTICSSGWDVDEGAPFRCVSWERNALSLPRFRRALIPAPRATNDVNNRQHHRHFDQHADHGRQRRARLEAEQRDRRRHGKFEEIGCADQRRRAGDAPLDAEPRGSASRRGRH